MHMSALPGHPFDLGPDWDRALAGGPVDWSEALKDYVATLDWPASAFWNEIREANPGATVLLSLRDSPHTWLQSMEATVLPVARMASAPDWREGHGLVRLLERFTGTDDWDRPATLLDAYQRQLETVRATVPSDQLLEWRPGDGWTPLCDALAVPVPSEPFPWLNRREDW
jgi:hypothetical protein